LSPCASKRPSPLPPCEYRRSPPRVTCPSVSCIEAGRWGYSRPSFAAGDDDLGLRRHQDRHVDDAVLLCADQLLAVEDEHGRVAAGRVLNPEIRYRKADAVTRNLKEKRLRFSDQRAVWDGVDKMLYALGSASPTRALSDGFENRAT
jgi:hypothetical protein